MEAARPAATLTLPLSSVYPPCRDGRLTADCPQEDEFEEVEVDVKYKTVTTLDWERVNANVAIWARDKDEITDDEYHNFYKVSQRRTSRGGCGQGRVLERAAEVSQPAVLRSKVFLLPTCFEACSTKERGHLRCGFIPRGLIPRCSTLPNARLFGGFPQ